MEQFQSEKGILAEDAGASIMKNVFADTLMGIIGKFKATCVGPLEHLRADYILLMNKRDEFIEAGQDKLAKGIQVVMNGMLEEKWTDEFSNLVTDEGKKYLLDLCFGTGSYTSVYMGLISSVSWTAVNVLDVAAQINGTNAWKEAGTASNFPLIGGTGLRLAPSFSAAAKATNVDKTTSSPVSFTIGTTGGTLKGCFLVINGTSALANATGKLYSAGAFSGGDKVVSAADTLNVSYTTSLI